MSDGRASSEAFSEFLQLLARTPEVAPELAEKYQALASGEVVLEGDLEVGEELAHGGMGRVFSGWDGKLERHVALKFVRFDGREQADAELLERAFAREARATAQLNHPNIVTVYGYGAWNGLPYLVLELLEGETLAERLAASPLTVAEAVEVTIQILRGLEHAHDHGVLHRDIKPQNVFVRSDEVVKIMDFGLTSLAWRNEVDAASSGRFTLLGAGTPGYMAPEQARGRAQDERTDLWAVGVLLHEMVAGAFPPESATHTAINLGTIDSQGGVGDGAGVTGVAPRPGSGCDGNELATRRVAASVPARVAAVIGQAIADEPGQRFADARTMRIALETSRDRGGRRYWLIGVALAALIGVGVGFAVTRKSAAPERSSPATAEIAAFHHARPGVDRPVALSAGPDLRGRWNQADNSQPDFVATLTRSGEHSYLYSRTTRPAEAEPSPEFILEEGELSLYRTGGRLYLAGTLLTRLMQREPQAEIVVEFEVVSADALRMTASFFRAVGASGFDYMYVDIDFVRVVD